MTFNGYGLWAIYRFEMARALRTIWQSVVTPVITTALYFVVFGSAIGCSQACVVAGKRKPAASRRQCSIPGTAASSS